MAHHARLPRLRLAAIALDLLDDLVRGRPTCPSTAHPPSWRHLDNDSFILIATGAAINAEDRRRRQRDYTAPCAAVIGSRSGSRGRSCAMARARR